MQFGHAGAQAGDYNLSFPFFHSLRWSQARGDMETAAAKNKAHGLNARKTAIPSAVGHRVSCRFLCS